MRTGHGGRTRQSVTLRCAACRTWTAPSRITKSAYSPHHAPCTLHHAPCTLHCTVMPLCPWSHCVAIDGRYKTEAPPRCAPPHLPCIQVRDRGRPVEVAQCAGALRHTQPSSWVSECHAGRGLQGSSTSAMQGGAGNQHASMAAWLEHCIMRHTPTS